MRSFMLFRRLLPALAAFCALVAFLPRAHADAAADARKAIQAATDREDAAVQKKDLQNAFAACAPDFHASDGKGHTSTVAQLKEQMQAVFGSAQTITTKNTVQKIALKGNQAVVTVAGHIEIIVPSLKGKTSRGVVDQVDEEVWLKSGSAWMRKSAKLLSQKLTRDGKAVAGQ